MHDAEDARMGRWAGAGSLATLLDEDLESKDVAAAATKDHGGDQDPVVQGDLQCCGGPILPRVLSLLKGGFPGDLLVRVRDGGRC